MTDCKNCGDPVYHESPGLARVRDGFCSLTCQYMWDDAGKVDKHPVVPPAAMPEEWWGDSEKLDGARFGMEVKPTNPKDAIGSDKLPVHLWPETATALGCLGLADGALKYGRGNFRAIGVKASIYIDATKRHLNAWFEGEDNDPDSGLPHLAHALATVAILVDAMAADKLTDDRNYRGGYRAWVDKLTPFVKLLKAKHAEKSPKHYTIEDCRDDVGVGGAK